MSIIYQITNKVNQKIYIGKTTLQLKHRFQRHFYNHKNGKTYLYKAMRKYGFENFDIVIIEECEENINDREIYWIKKLNPDYNMTLGGDGGSTSSSPNFIKSMEDYHKRRTKDSYATYGMKGKKQSQKFFNSISKANSKPVMCEGTRYDSIKSAQEAYPGISLRKRLDSPKYPQFYRV